MATPKKNFTSETYKIRTKKPSSSLKQNPTSSIQFARAIKIQQNLNILQQMSNTMLLTNYLDQESESLFLRNLRRIRRVIGLFCSQKTPPSIPISVNPEIYPKTRKSDLPPIPAKKEIKVRFKNPQIFKYLSSYPHQCPSNPSTRPLPEAISEQPSHYNVVLSQKPGLHAVSSDFPKVYHHL